MYLVACKWLASGTVSYKKPMDYFLYLADKDPTAPINHLLIEESISLSILFSRVFPRVWEFQKAMSV